MGGHNNIITVPLVFLGKSRYQHLLSQGQTVYHCNSCRCHNDVWRPSFVLVCVSFSEKPDCFLFEWESGLLFSVLMLSWTNRNLCSVMDVTWHHICVEDLIHVEHCFPTWVRVRGRAVAHSSRLWLSSPPVHPSVGSLAWSLRSLLQLLQEFSQSSVAPGSGDVERQTSQRIRNSQSSRVPLVEHQCCLSVAQCTCPHLRRTKENKDHKQAWKHTNTHSQHHSGYRSLTSGVQEKWSTLSGSTSNSRSILSACFVLRRQQNRN